MQGGQDEQDRLRRDDRLMRGCSGLAVFLHPAGKSMSGSWVAHASLLLAPRAACVHRSSLLTCCFLSLRRSLQGLVIRVTIPKSAQPLVHLPALPTGLAVWLLR